MDDRLEDKPTKFADSDKLWKILQWGSISQRDLAGSGDLHNKNFMGFNKGQCEVLHLREKIVPNSSTDLWVISCGIAL